MYDLYMVNIELVPLQKQNCGAWKIISWLSSLEMMFNSRQFFGQIGQEGGDLGYQPKA